MSKLPIHFVLGLFLVGFFVLDPVSAKAPSGDAAELVSEPVVEAVIVEPEVQAEPPELTGFTNEAITLVAETDEVDIPRAVLLH